jgi:hypothetical protein
MEGLKATLKQAELKSDEVLKSHPLRSQPWF